jgi:hypothetical protein
MRVTFIAAILLGCLYFVVGGVLVQLGWFDEKLFTFTTTIVGGVVGFIGLGSLVQRPAVTATDMRNVEVELVQDLADTMAQLKEYEARISTNKQEVDRLQRERTEIELVVRQTSLKVFMEERLKNLSSEIEDRVRYDDRLFDLMRQYEETKSLITQVEGQIEESGKAELIGEILGGIAQQNELAAIHVEVLGVRIDVTPFVELAKEVADMYARPFRRLYQGRMRRLRRSRRRPRASPASEPSKPQEPTT